MISAKVYISGPISGIRREHYVERFRLAEQMLRSLGYDNIVNPTRIWACRFPKLNYLIRLVFGEQRAYTLILLYDLWLLSRCQRIYKIPGWKDSRGAQIESAVAYNYNMFLINRHERIAIDGGIEKLIKKQEGKS